jgi:hypothetical protein
MELKLTFKFLAFEEKVSQKGNTYRICKGLLGNDVFTFFPEPSDSDFWKSCKNLEDITVISEITIKNSNLTIIPTSRIPKTS